jgi:uncharacterized protein YidB (DUF937 family)
LYLVNYSLQKGKIMGLLDSVLGSVLGGGSSQGSNPLMQMALQMLMNNGGNAGGAGGAGGGLGGMLGGMLGGGQSNAAAPSVGGLGGIMDAFQKGGLGHIADSWVSQGDNMPVSGDQISSVFGQDKIAAMASQLGMSHSDVSGGLAQILPQLVNHVTPNGQVPQDHSMIQDALGSLFKR